MRFSTSIFLIGCLALSACDKYNQSETPMLNKFEEKTVQCLGRYNFTLPADFKQLSGSTAEFRAAHQSSKIGTVTLKVIGANVERKLYEQGVRERLAELSTQRDSNLDKFEEAKNVSPELSVFRVRKVGQTHVTEIHANIDNAYIVATLKSRDEKYAEALNELLRFARNISLSDNRADHVRTDGFCIGPVIVQGAYDVESVSTAYRSAIRPDVVLKIMMNTFVGDEPETLFDRVSGQNSLLNIFNMPHKVLRKREFKFGEMRAQEWLANMTDPDTHRKHFTFSLETLRQNPSLLSPKIHIDFDTGTKGPDGVGHETSMSESEAVDFWDNFIASVHPRALKEN
jgi:hypothetical protein